MKLKARHWVARGLARALLAGPPKAPGLRARARAALGVNAGPWIDRLVAELLALPRYRWRRWTVTTLAAAIEASPCYAAGWRGEPLPRLRRHILRPPRQHAPPLGLDGCPLPHWPTPGDIAAGLGLSIGALWRLTLPSRWQRQLALGEQLYRARWRRKAHGGWRLIEVPDAPLKALQRRLLRRLLDAIPVHEAAHGGVRGRGVVGHARLHCGAEVVLRFDIADFYGHVRASRVHAMFRTLGYPEAASRTLTALCTTATPEPVLERLREDLGLPWAQAQRLRDAHLPQGAPTSNALANLCAFRLDLRLDALARQWQLRYSRYVDDLAFSGAALRASAGRFQASVAAIAADEGYRLNHRKTTVMPARRRQSLCGVVVNRHPNLPRDEFDRLRALLHRRVHGLETDPPGLGRAQLLGRLQWATQVNPAKAERLWRLYRRIVWPDEAPG